MMHVAKRRSLNKDEVDDCIIFSNNSGEKKKGLGHTVLVKLCFLKNYLLNLNVCLKSWDHSYKRS